MLSKAKLSEHESPHEELREMVQAYGALKKTQSYRDDDMLQRAILQALDVEAYHTLHMFLESRVDSGISTTALMHEIQQYYASYVSKRAGTAAMAASASPNCARICDVCGVGAHWIKSCPIVNRARELVAEEARVAAASLEAETAAGVATAARRADFWYYSQIEDGSAW